MVKCARCGRDVDELQDLTPDAITKELIDSLDHGEEALAGDADIRVCADCVDELNED